ncbi:major capsid protein [Sulfitobacter pontiacus]
MTLDIYTPRRLALIQQEESQTVRASNWLNMFFPNTFLSDQEQIMFNSIDASREIAPFMLPHLPGKPIYRRDGERIKMFTPAYTKPKDSVSPGMGMKRTGPELVGRVPQMTPEARIAAAVGDITFKHIDGIVRLWEYMGARSVLDGRFTVNYTDNPAQNVTLDFGRDPGHTITKGAGARWGEAGVSAWDDVQEWVDTVAAADYGATPTDIMMGSDAYKAFMKDADVQKKLDRDVKGVDKVLLDQGMIVKDKMNPWTLVGMFGTIRVWLVSGIGNTFQSGGNRVDILKKNEVFIASQAVDGVRAFGAIEDLDSMQATEIFASTWVEQDPSRRFLMHQSAPLMIPVNLNATLLATPVALI